MPFEWATWPPDLLLPLDPGDRESLGAQLQRSLRTAIQTGRLGNGERLPSTRRLAAELGVSRGLVQAAYEQLEAEGYLSARAGSGTRVARGRLSQASTPVAAGPRPRIEADFLPGIPDLSSFPVRDWTWAAGEAARRLPVDDLGYGDPQGLGHLREILAAYLQRVRGAYAGAADVLVCNGFTQGLAMTLATLRDSGVSTVAVEDPGHPAMPALVRQAGMRIAPVPVDSEGAIVEAIADSPARAVILTPAHQTPTGAVLSPARRLALTDWADRIGGIVIEDDYDSEFRYDKQPVGCLQGLMPERVITIGSVSKTLAPTVRIGWVVAPPHVLAPLAAHKELVAKATSALDQMTLALLLESGRFDRHLRRMRPVYAQRRAALVRAMADHVPQVRLTGLDAGFHALARLEHGDEGAIVEGAWERSVRLQGLSRYLHATDEPDHDPRPAGIVFGFGQVRESAIPAAVERIADLFAG